MFVWSLKQLPLARSNFAQLVMFSQQKPTGVLKRGYNGAKVTQRLCRHQETEVCVFVPSTEGNEPQHSWLQFNILERGSEKWRRDCRKVKRRLICGHRVYNQGHFHITSPHLRGCFSQTGSVKVPIRQLIAGRAALQLPPGSSRSASPRPERDRFRVHFPPRSCLATLPWPQQAPQAYLGWVSVGQPSSLLRTDSWICSHLYFTSKPCI